MRKLGYLLALSAVLSGLVAGAVPAVAGAGAMVPSGNVHFEHARPAVDSSNWSGYDTAATGTFHEVESSWVQPAVDCSHGDGYDVWWVGLDGGFHSNDSDVEQEGTGAQCQGGQATYQAWWETAPCLSIQQFNDPVAPGDQMYAKTTDSNGQYTLYLQDKTAGWTEQPVESACSGAQDSSAEVVLETPSYGTNNYANLADFGTSTFTGSMVDGKSLGDSNPESITLHRKDSGNDLDSVSSLSNGTDFTVTWKANS